MVKRVFSSVPVLSIFLPALLLFQTNYGMKKVKEERYTAPGKTVSIDSQVYFDLKKLTKIIDYLEYLRKQKNTGLEGDTIEDVITINKKIKKNFNN